MMDYPLTLTIIIERAHRLFSGKEVVTRTSAGLQRRTYGEIYARACRLAHALRQLGVRPSDRVATLAWNTADHLEVYLATPCSGAVLHTLNIRLPLDHLTYVANHAGDTVLFVDQSLLPLLERFRERLKTVRQVVVMNEGEACPRRAGDLGYEELLAAAEPDFHWPRLDEHSAAAMCYTSGTTGFPKGCVYSHRALVLHTYGLSLADVFGISERDVVMPVVPMFHANAWGFPWAAAFMGSKQVLPGADLQPAALAQLIQDEGVSVAAGVPTVWVGLLAELEKGTYDVSSLRLCPCGGAAVPRRIIEVFRRKFGISVVHAWGMTEICPLGSVSLLRGFMEAWDEERQLDALALQGTPAPGIEIRVIDANGREVAWDGAGIGELQVRGPWVLGQYFMDPRSAESFSEGWFCTGDVVTVNRHGMIRILDRTRDLIKSGGEWISSLELETSIMAHPQVLEAAVIAYPDAKWGERPFACVVPKQEHQGALSAQDILRFLAERLPSWWLPDDIVFLDALPKTSVGKFDKNALRKRFLPQARPAP
jgi:fatty-acyl-CoA synthase